MRRRDSLADAEVFRYEEEGVRAILLPSGYFLAAPSPTSPWQTTRLPDGRWFAAIAREDLAEMVVETVRQIRHGTGSVSDRRYELLRKLSTDAEWREAEQIVAMLEAGTSPN